MDGIRNLAASSGASLVLAIEDSLGEEGWLGGTPMKVPGAERREAETVRPAREIYGGQGRRI